MKEFKVGDEVIFIDKDLQLDWGSAEEVSVYEKIGEIICVGTWTNDNIYYLLRFEIKDSLYVITCKADQLKALDSLKFKKWIGK